MLLMINIAIWQKGQKMKYRAHWEPPTYGEKKDNEVTCYTVAVGNLPLPPFVPKASREAVDYIKTLDGFVGFYPMYPNGTLCLFKSENEAKAAKNLMNAKGIRTGLNICEVFVDRAYVDK